MCLNKINITIKPIIVLLMIFLFQGCRSKKEELEHTTVAKGIVRNFYTKEPIEGSFIHFYDGIPNEGQEFFYLLPTTSFAKTYTKTNSNGEFVGSFIHRKTPYLGVLKENFYTESPDLNREGLFKISNGYSKGIFEVKPYLQFKGTFISKEQNEDSLKIEFYYRSSPQGFTTLIPYYGLQNDAITYGTSPNDHSPMFRENTYLHYAIFVKKNNQWINKIERDSILFKPNTPFTDTINH